MDISFFEKWKKPVLVCFTLFNMIATFLGIPILALVRPSYHFYLFDYFFMVLHSTFFILASIFTFQFISFTYRSYLVYLPKNELMRIPKIWGISFLLATISFVFAFGSVAYHDWNRYLTAPILHESTPSDHSSYGSLFSFGPWGWVLFLLFILASEILINSVITIFIVVYGVIMGNVTSSATEEEWRSWMNLYLVFLIWTIIFTLPFSESSGLRMTAFYFVVLISPVLGFVSGSFIIGKFRKMEVEIKSIDEMMKTINQTMETIRKNRIFRDVAMIFASLTLFLLINRYLKTSNHFLNNSLLFIFSCLVLLSILMNDLISFEGSLEETLGTVYGTDEVASKSLEVEGIKELLNMKMSQIFLLSYICQHEPVEMGTLKRAYPNGYGQFRSSIQSLSKNGLILKKPNILKMNSMIIELEEAGRTLLNNFQMFLDSINRSVNPGYNER